MNANARAWVEDLRSGRFSQTKGQLYDPDTDGYCCLGVATERYRQEVGGEWEGELFVDAVGKQGVAELTVDVRLWFGLCTDNGAYTGASLSHDNDVGKSFAEIADTIEARADELFVE